MSENVDVTLLQKQVAELRKRDQSIAEASWNRDDHKGISSDMDLTEYRLSQSEKRAEAADERMGRIEDKLTQIQIGIASLATKDSMRNWALGIMALILTALTGLGALLMQSSGNQLASFQAGLSAVQTVAGARDQPPTQTPRH